MKKNKRLLAGIMVACMSLTLFGTVSFANTDTTLAIENSKIFDLEITSSGGVSDSKGNIPVTVQKATNADYSTIDTQTIYTADGTATNYLMIENTMLETQGISGMKARGQAALVAPTAAYSGVYAESDKFTGDEITIELWAKLSYLDTLSPFPGGEIITSFRSYNSENVSTDTSNSVGNIGLGMWNDHGGKPITKPEMSWLYASGGYGEKTINSLTASGYTDFRFYCTKWAQIVMTRKKDGNNYKYYLYVNSHGADLDTVKSYRSKEIAQAISDELNDAMGLITAGMPSSVLTSTADTYNDSLRSYELGDIRVYNGIMTADEALEIYNRDKVKYVESKATVAPASGTVFTPGNKKITVSYEAPVSEDNRTLVSLKKSDNSSADVTYSWANDYKSVEIEFTAENVEGYVLTYPDNPIANITNTALYSIATDINDTKIFDLEIAADGNVSNSASDISVTAQTATNPLYSTLSTKKILNEDGTERYYLSAENTMLDNFINETTIRTSECPKVTPKAAYSGVYAESDMFKNDEITVEIWSKFTEFSTPPEYTSTMFGLTSYDTTGASVTAGSMSLSEIATKGDKNTAGKFITIDPTSALLKADGAYGTKRVDQIRNSGPVMDYFNDWAQIVMTRKPDGNGNYVYSLYVNSPSGEGVSSYVSKDITVAIPSEKIGRVLLTAGMPASGANATGSTTNMSPDTIEIGDIRVYTSSMTAEQALEIYNRDKENYVNVVTDDVSILDTKLYEGTEEVQSVNGVENVKVTGSVISELDKDVKLIAALYDNDGRMFVSAKSVEIIANTTTPLDIQFENKAVENGFIRLFVWDNFEGLRPYTKGEIIGEAAD